VDATTGAVTARTNGTGVRAGGVGAPCTRRKFTTVNGTTRNRAAAVDATTGAVTAWDPNANNIVYAVASGSTST
jgi:hypothetical protein